jgi:nucleoid-associated protein YgaU
MGLFEFLKNAGKKLHLTHDDEPAKGAPAPSAGAPAGPSAEQVQAAIDRRREGAMTKLVQDMGFQVSGLAIASVGETVTVKGAAANQQEREKIVLLLGNTDGVAKVDDQLTVTQEEPQATFYTVKSGDTLSHIAKAHYGNANKYMVIFEANKPMLKDPDEIYPGQVLRVPAQN